MAALRMKPLNPLADDGLDELREQWGADDNAFDRAWDRRKTRLAKHAQHNQKDHGNRYATVQGMRDWIVGWADNASKEHRVAVTQAMRRWKASPRLLEDEHRTALSQAISESPIADFDLHRGTGFAQLGLIGGPKGYKGHESKMHDIPDDFFDVGDEITVKRDTGWTSDARRAQAYGEVILRIPAGSVQAFPIDDMVAPGWGDQKWVPARERMRNIEGFTMHHEGEYVAASGTFKVTDVEVRKSTYRTYWLLTVEPVA